MGSWRPLPDALPANTVTEKIPSWRTAIVATRQIYAHRVAFCSSITLRSSFQTNRTCLKSSWIFKIHTKSMLGCKPDSVKNKSSNSSRKQEGRPSKHLHHVQYKASWINDLFRAFKALRRVFSLPALSVTVNGSFVDDTTSQTEGEILRQSVQFAGTCHPYLPRRGLGKWELFEWVPCLNNSYLRPATASWWLSVPVLWADAKTSWHDKAWVRTVWWQNTRLDVNTHQLQSICLYASSYF